MVARNAAPYIDAAIRSARAQTFTDLELVVLDDGSTDDTRAIAEGHAAQDPRVRVLDGPCAGLAANRNASLAAARGRHAAILDSDDVLHPAHVERLTAAAARTGAEIVAANMVSFRVDAAGRHHAALFADHPAWDSERWITLPAYVRANSAYGDAVSAGYLKPLFCMTFLRQHALNYDTRLRIAEDYDLVARALAAGARMLFLPRPTYFYRRHDASTSHRQSVADLSAMLAAADAVGAGNAPPVLAEAVARRRSGIESALRHARAVDAAKARRPDRALAALGADRAAWRMLAGSVGEGLARRFARPARRTEQAPGPAVLMLGDPLPGSTLAAQVDARVAAGEHIIRRRPPRDNRERGRLADGLPRLEAVIVAPPATADDAAYALLAGHPAVTGTP